MLTRCPSPDCKHTCDFADVHDNAVAVCPHCHQIFTVRALELWDQIEQKYRRRTQSGLTRGGPAGQSHVPVRFSALVEDVRSLWNVGSIFRSADGAGFSLLYLCGITGCPPAKEIAKTSLGAEDSVVWEYHTGALDVLPSLKKAGTQIIGLERTGESKPLVDAIGQDQLKTPLCLVLGNEVSGLSAEALSFCDLVCHLPMRGSKESLNVAVAFGIAAYFLTEHLSASAAGTTSI